MDTTEAKGMLNEATGKVQEAIGSGAGDAMSQIKGRVGQVAGTTVAISSFWLGLLIGSAGATKNLIR
ncbi:CsbD-like protein [Caballeronia pedi]|uniref:CsbD-like protein n=1 Tax=Caballeronia pedi TaxID=1777141 RepID=A0A158D3F0_9BURK|nr:CsbD family protein [Caballeronia pedi]SAK88726.1 CsbD-like protein [Caballeronia pedi]